MKRFLFLALLLAGCSGGGGGSSCNNPLCAYPGLLSPNSGWTDYGSGAGAALVGPLPNPFSIPSQASGQTINYVYTKAPTLAVGQTITLNYSVSGNATFAPLPESSCGSAGCGPALVRLFIWAGNDVGSTNAGRWWCNAQATPLVIGDNQTISCQLEFENWGGAGVGSDPINATTFAAVLNAPFAVGFTFGGEFAGHGDWVTSGSATFTVNSFTVQ